LLTDANGAFGRLVEYAPVTAVVSAPGYATQLHDWSEQRRDLVATNFALEPDTSDLRALDLRVTPGRKSVLVSWRTEAPSRGRVIYGLDSLCGSGGIQVDSRLGTRHVVLIGSLYAGATDDPMEYWLRVVSDSPERGTNYSHAVRIVPAMWPIPAGEWDVRLTGEWTFVPTSQAGPPQGFWRAFITSGGPTPTAIWSVPIEVTGNYDIQFWTSGNYANSYDVHTVRTNFTVNVQQPPPGQLLRPLATNVFLLRGERPEVRLVNPGFTSYLLAGHMSWVYREGQDPPPPNTLPAWWAEHFFREPVDPLADPDADGFSNYSEFGFGTDPTDPDSQLRLRLEADPEDGWQLVFSPVTGGRTYSLQRADDLTSGIWETAPIHSWVVTPLPSGEWSVAVASPQAGPQFYRLGVSF